jgi:hypothetical protein
MDKYIAEEYEKLRNRTQLNGQLTFDGDKTIQ